MVSMRPGAEGQAKRRGVDEGTYQLNFVHSLPQPLSAQCHEFATGSSRGSSSNSSSNNSDSKRPEFSPASIPEFPETYRGRTEVLWFGGDARNSGNR
jgi:hypothetical protein